jgi:hypothetical protein
VRTVQVNGHPPRAVTVREILGGESLKTVAVWPYMVVNHVENYRKPERVCPVHKTAPIVRSPVQVRWGEEIDPVITPNGKSRRNRPRA